MVRVDVPTAMYAIDPLTFDSRLMMDQQKSPRLPLILSLTRTEDSCTGDIPSRLSYMTSSTASVTDMGEYASPVKK